MILEMEEDRRPEVEPVVGLMEVGQGQLMSTLVVFVYVSVMNVRMTSKMSGYLKVLVLLIAQ